MATKGKFQAIRGTRDLLPPDTTLWNHVEQTAREVFATYGFGEIRPPIFEPTELFARAVGGETDIVSKEMYTFEDRPLKEFLDIRRLVVSYGNQIKAGSVREVSFLHDVRSFLEEYRAAKEQGAIPENADNNRNFSTIETYCREVRRHIDGQALLSAEHLSRSLMTIVHRVEDLQLSELAALRPEATASVCRAYIEHNMQLLPQPVKLYYMGPMFRRERPQKGRYRQFYQIGAEVLETTRPDTAKDAAKELAKDAAVDAEVIEMLVTFFERVGLQGAELSINSIGHPAENCRRGYVELLRGKLLEVKERLGADSQRRIETNPLRVLDSKLEHEQPIIEKLPRIADHLCDSCKAHYAELKRQLDLRAVKYVENWRLVRGLDYYMRTTFEITARGLGSQNAVCGGGRYDGLVELLGGPPTKGIGFAIGEDRLILSLQESARAEGGKPQSPVTSHEPCSVYIAWMGAKAYETAIRAAKSLRSAGIGVELPPAELKFGKALAQADKLGAKYALILGDNEIQSGEWTLKTLADGSQQKFNEPQLLEYLQTHK